MSPTSNSPAASSTRNALCYSASRKVRDLHAITFAADITAKQGATSHLDGRWTMVLEKRAKGWVVVHEHVSAPLGAS
ncbi:MAG: hypothetical protein DMG40_04885 [Acidobacteria bacterium]|nr:MAG: hypothetical protein DMG40_04885 [Acidobacteriota bacterium]